MDIDKLKLLFNTIKYLKPLQLYYRFYYFFRNKFFYKEARLKPVLLTSLINWQNKIYTPISFFDSNSFRFLNISHHFSNKIDWNYSEYGKLWTYNLNYFDFLNQENISKEKGIILIKDYIKNDNLLIDGKEPYPISLRGINWVKFLAENSINDISINNSLNHHYRTLLINLEFHILGNHLLENAFSLLFGAYYFKDNSFYHKSKKLLFSELNEQILDDGAHFELSPMYHQIIFFHLLDCINLIKLNQSWKQDNLLSFLEEKAILMFSWLKNITYKNGSIPMVNDSTYNIAPSSQELFKYAKGLGIDNLNNPLSVSGYRKISFSKYELFIDFGEIGPSYQPGHAHSDTFNFELIKNSKPFIVDRGVSTYEKNTIRQIERSTSSHNTITIGNYEQTDVWGGFRVAKRANIISLMEVDNEFSSSHDGYKKIGLIHNRKFITYEDSVHIYDELNKQDVYDQIAHFHFHPSIKNIVIKDSSVFFKNRNIKMLFDGKSISIEKESYKYAHGFNSTEDAIKLKVVFKSNLKTIINL